MSIRKLVFALSCVALGTVGAWGSREFQSPSTQVALVELFTSEGCSSCPAAEQWLSGLLEQPGLWKRFVPVSFHVDYWDQLGWPDALATRGATQREYAYARRWGSATVYTPCFVLNGHEWRRNVKALDAATAPAGVLRLAIENDGAGTIEFSPARGDGGRFTAQVVLLGSGIDSSVLRGENAGRRLRHDFAVLAFSGTALTKRSDGRWFGRFAPLKASVPRAGRRAIAAWVMPEGSLEPIQATGGWLDEAAEGR